MCEEHIPVYVQSVRNVRRYVVTYALWRNLPPLSYLFAFQTLSLAHATKFSFDISRIDDFYFVRFLSLSSFFVFSLLHTIIAFVPLRSSIVLNFHVATPRRKKREKKEKRTPIDSSSQLKRGNAAYTKKGPSQKRACALACLLACN